MVERTEEAVDAYLGCFHRDIELTASLSGLTVAASGLGELRAVVENVLAAGLSYESRDIQVVSEAQSRVVTHYTGVMFHDGTVLTEAAAEVDFTFEGELIRRMIAGDLGRPADAGVAWAALGSRPSLTGEIVAHRSNTDLLVRLRDGREVELPSPVEAQGQWAVGDALLVYYDGAVPVGWYLPERQFGVDLRRVG
jgi:hypothetical protein